MKLQSKRPTDVKDELKRLLKVKPGSRKEQQLDRVVPIALRVGNNKCIMAACSPHTAGAGTEKVRRDISANIKKQATEETTKLGFVFGGFLMSLFVDKLISLIVDWLLRRYGIISNEERL